MSRPPPVHVERSERAMRCALSDEALAFVQQCQIAIDRADHGDPVGLLGSIWNCLRLIPQVRSQADRIAVSSAVLRIAWHLRHLVNDEWFGSSNQPPLRLTRRERVAAVLGLIATSKSQPSLRLEMIAEMTGVSASHLCRALHAETGWGFLVHLDGVRILDGALLLRASPLPVKSIAREIGFRTTSDFDHSFKKWFHMTPCEFRSSLRIGSRADYLREQIAALLRADATVRLAAVADSLGADLGLVIEIADNQSAFSDGSSLAEAEPG